jgi:hypothetical protein
MYALVLRASFQSSYLGDKFRAREVADWVVGGDAARAFARSGPETETPPEAIKALEEVLNTDTSERPESGAVGATRVW